MKGAGLEHHAKWAVLLGFAAAIQFCVLNPQPEPPNSGTGTGTTGGSTAGGTGGSGGTGGGGGAGGTGIDPRHDGGPITTADAGRVLDARSDGAADAFTDATSADGDGSTDDDAPTGADVPSDPADTRDRDAAPFDDAGDTAVADAAEGGPP